jgi:hypothetical protein
MHDNYQVVTENARFIGSHLKNVPDEDNEEIIIDKVLISNYKYFQKLLENDIIKILKLHLVTKHSYKKMF